MNFKPTLFTLLSTLFLFSSLQTATAQNIATQLPENTFLAFTFNGEQLNEKMTVSYFENLPIYSEVRKELEREGLSGNFNDIGIDMLKEGAFFLSIEQEAYLIGGLILPCNNRDNLRKLIGNSYQEYISEGDLTYVHEYSDFTGYSSNYVVLTFSEVILDRGWNDDTAREKYEKARESKKQVHAEVSLNILRGVTNSLADNANFKKSYDSNADANLFIALTDEVTQAYVQSMTSAAYYLGGMNGMNDMVSSYAEGDQFWRSSLYFNEDDIHVKSVFTANDFNAKIQKEISDSKMNKKLLSYIPSDKLLGTFSVNLNVENVLVHGPDYVAPLMNSMQTSLMNEFGNSITDILAVIIDEEAIGDLLPGNGIISVSDYSMKDIEFISYDYDEDFNRVETVKTRQQNMPDVISMFSTNDAKNLNNILKLLTFDGDHGLVEKDGYYILPGGRDLPFTMYFFIYDDIFFVSNSLNQMTQIRSGQSLGTAPKAIAKNMAKSSQSAYIDFQNIFSAISPRDIGGGEKELAYLAEHLNSMELIQHKPKGNTVISEMTINLPGKGHENGLKYLFNMMNDFYVMVSN